jgi:hypothetical protein
MAIFFPTWLPVYVRSQVHCALALCARCHVCGYVAAASSCLHDCHLADRRSLPDPRTCSEALQERASAASAVQRCCRVPLAWPPSDHAGCIPLQKVLLLASTCLFSYRRLPLSALQRAVSASNHDAEVHSSTNQWPATFLRAVHACRSCSRQLLGTRRGRSCAL